MKGIRLLLKNAFRSAGRNKSQIIGLSLLVMLVSLVISLLSATTTRIIEAYKDLNTKSNLRDVVMEVNPNDRIKLEDENNEKNWYMDFDESALANNQELYQQYLMNQLSFEYGFDWSRTEGRTLASTTINNNDLKIKALAKTNGTSNAVDSLVISKGRNIENKNEIIVGESFAKKHNIELGSIVRVQEDKFGNSFLVNQSSDTEMVKEIEGLKIKEILDIGKYANMVWFEVVGYGSSADFATPLLDQTSVITNIASEVIVYLDPTMFGLEIAPYEFSDKVTKGIYNRNMYTYVIANSPIVVTSESDKESYYSIKFRDGYDQNLIDTINNKYKAYASIGVSTNYFFDNNDEAYTFSGRIKTFETVIIAYNTTSIILLVTIISIASLTILLITKKQIDQQRRQIGCLKALGYKKREVINNFIAAPLIVSVIGSLLGYVISIFLEYVVVNSFSLYFNVSFYDFQFNVFSFLSGLLLVWILLTVLSFIIGYSVIKTSALTLLKGGDDKAISKFGTKMKLITAKGSFNTRLRTALTITSLGKLAGVSATMLLGTTLMTTTIVAPKVMKDNMTATFNGMNYENLVEYEQPLANNPLSFYKTYNPNKVDGWGFDINDSSNKKIDMNYDSTTAKLPSWTGLPVTTDGNFIDYDKMFDDLYKGKIDNSFYAFDVTESNSYSWSKMSYLNWKNLSTDFLRVLDRIVPDSYQSLAIGTLLSQWPDHSKLLEFVGVHDAKTYLLNMLWFYNKYTQGLKIEYNPITVKDNISIDVTLAQKQLDKKFTKKEMKVFWTPEVTPEFKIDQNAYSADFVPIESNYFNSIHDITEDTIDKMLNDNKNEELLQINYLLTIWFGATFGNRMSTAILETTYSRAPYFVQEYIKNSWEENKNYNIAFNLNPFDYDTEEMGTMLNTQFKNRNSENETLKVYGVNKNTNLVSLQDKKGLDLKNNLFALNSNTTPIIINQTTAIKSGLKNGDKINLKVFKELLSKDGEAIEFDGTKNKEEINLGFESENTYYKTQSVSGYFSTKNKTFADTTKIGILPPIPSSVASGSYSSYKLTGDSATVSTNQTQIHKAYSDGNIAIQSYDDNYEFEIVGIQNGYGQPQAWISNDVANEVMGYDLIEKFNFEQWFSKEYLNIPEFYNSNFLGKNGQELENIFNETIGKYEEFKELLNSEDEEISFAANKINELFKKLYPIYNYKYSPNPEILDLIKGFSTSQKFGDFSSQGLNGNFEFKKVDPECNDQETNCEMEVDPTKFVEGFGIGSLKTMMPMEQTRQILGQITDLVNMIIIMFMVIALIVSTTIILLTTSLIIYENKQFIATMKTLGYSNGYVVKQILSTYIWAVLAMFTIGFIVGWYLFEYAALFLALNTSWVLPVQFAWYLPVGVLGVLSGICLLTFGVGWSNIQKINPVVALSIKD
ncbi:ABC transporter permease [Spiroplasma culicicola]|uniref:ABC transporter permease n=1 Tax=Spiroplasma culicicola AES-1 TaxID=1276246 RepID=W6A8E4_9MOLU|nr:ABC transporter permease [Spiroplasma culicicola]AHI53272.1 ABC transporter permease [Spiroplasma culicicola AES-1]